MTSEQECARTAEEGALYLVEDRLETFKNSHWPFDAGPCTPQKMAEAGFYYCGTSQSPDWVRCVVCHHDMEGWEPEDIPQDEHRRHSPTCAFLKIKDPYKITVGDILDMEKAALEQYIKIEADKFERDLQGEMEDLKDQLIETSMAKKKH